MLMNYVLVNLLFNEGFKLSKFSDKISSIIVLFFVKTFDGRVNLPFLVTFLVFVLFFFNFKVVVFEKRLMKSIPFKF